MTMSYQNSPKVTILALHSLGVILPDSRRHTALNGKDKYPPNPRFFKLTLNNISKQENFLLGTPLLLCTTGLAFWDTSLYCLPRPLSLWELQHLTWALPVFKVPQFPSSPLSTTGGINDSFKNLPLVSEFLEKTLIFLNS